MKSTTTMRLKPSKKAVSGLIVAVLLLAVSLTIGGLVIGWISGYTGDSLDTASKSNKQQDSCGELDWKVVSVKTNGNLSSSVSMGQNLNFNVTVENKNDETIKGFLFKYIPYSGDSLVTVTNNTASDALTQYDRNTYYHHTSMNSGQVNGFTKVEIYPIIDVTVDSTVETVCTSKMKTIEKKNFVNS